MVRLPPGRDGKSREIPITDPKCAAWVVVAPPKFAVGVHSIVTLYDVIREVAIAKKWIKDDPRVDYRRDIQPILLRAADTAWVNDEARRGHGYDKRGHFGQDLATDDRVLSARIFRRRARLKISELFPRKNRKKGRQSRGWRPGGKFSVQSNNSFTFQ